MRTTHHDRHRCAQNADHLTHNRPFSAFFAEVVCTLGAIPPQTVISPSPNGGNGVIRDPTRRRHAASQFLMLQNPHRRREGTRATGVPPDARPDCGTCGRRARPRRPWAAARPGRASTQRTEPYVSTPNAAGVEGAKGICRCARGRWRGLAGLRGDAPSEARSADGSRAGRRPGAHKAARPNNTPRGARNTGGATRHVATTKPPSPTGAGRLRQSAREGQRRITTMSGSPRPLS